MGSSAACTFFWSPTDVPPFVFNLNQNVALLSTGTYEYCNKLHITYVLACIKHVHRTVRLSWVEFCVAETTAGKKVKWLQKNFFRSLAFSTLLLFKFYWDAVVRRVHLYIPYTHMWIRIKPFLLRVWIWIFRCMCKMTTNKRAKFILCDVCNCVRQLLLCTEV